MPTTRRMNGRRSEQNTVEMPSTSTQTPSSQSRIPHPTQSPYLPTGTETLLLATYPAILLLGSLYSHFSPTISSASNGARYSTVDQSYQPAHAAPSYFAQKSNVFNLYFVKIGWFWTTVAFWAFGLLVARGRLAGVSEAKSRNTTSNRRQQDDQIRRYWQLAFRYGLATLFWIITTQWCFGPPLVDRGFALTGGVCDIASSRLQELQLQQGAGQAEDLVAKEKAELARALTHAACRVAGGAWKGGYDISGHVFLLVLGSGVLLMEMLPFIFPRIKGVGIGRVLRTDEAGDRHVAHEVSSLAISSEADLVDGGDVEKENTLEVGMWSVGTYATALALAVVVLSMWMLLMTSVFFHTWFEKLTGLVWSLSNLWVIYFFPRGHAGFRSVFGMPGL